MPANISSPVRSSRRAQRHISANDDSTDDGRVTSSPPLPPALGNFRLGQTETPAPDSPSKRSNTSNTQTRRIGAIGARSSSQALPASSPPKPYADIETDRGLRSRTMLSPTPSSMMPPQSQVSPRKRRLGGIGRGSSQMQPSLSRWSSQAPPILEEDQQDNADLDLRLTSTARESREDTVEIRQTRGKRKASEERESKPEETSADRADRKRQELKQNEKSKAPVKRKRRF